jgi:AraC-like DNA-binding protein
MVSHRYKPLPPLDRFVEVIWVMEAGPAPHAKERLLPDGSAELIFNLDDAAFPIFSRDNLNHRELFRRSIVCGPHSQPFGIDTSVETKIAGVHFKPGGAHSFLKLPFGELHNTHVGLDSLWGTATANRVRDQLLGARTPESKARVIEAALRAAAQIPERHPAIAFALNEFRAAPETQKISEVTGQIGLSPRRFIELFRNEVGLTPKLFCRVRRFQKVLRQISAGHAVSWTEVALQCGYFDQAHFIHDFRAFSGINPSSYTAEYAGHANHVPIT